MGGRVCSSMRRLRRLRQFLHPPFRLLASGCFGGLMRTIAMCFSLLQFPRCRIHSLANSCWDSFYRLGGIKASRYSYKIICSNFNPEGGYIKKYSTRSAKTGENNESLTSHTGVTHEIFPETRTQTESCELGTGKVQKSKKVSIRNKIISQSTCSNLTSTASESDQYYTYLAKLATVICFDSETTGFSKEDRIIEFACQDLRGGENSTLQTLINPERDVKNERIHGISASMVCTNDVPRMKHFIPILLKYVRSRQMPGGVVVLVSHNGRRFDVPFLKHEFSRCSYNVPEDWLFVDTLDLARALMNSKGCKEDRSKINLQSLREYYNIPLFGEAHRALSDVHTLALVFQRLTFDLKLSLPGVIKTSFK